MSSGGHTEGIMSRRMRNGDSLSSRPLEHAGSVLSKGNSSLQPVEATSGCHTFQIDFHSNRIKTEWCRSSVLTTTSPCLVALHCSVSHFCTSSSLFLFLGKVCRFFENFHKNAVTIQIATFVNVSREKLNV